MHLDACSPELERMMAANRKDLKPHMDSSWQGLRDLDEALDDQISEFDSGLGPALLNLLRHLPQQVQQRAERVRSAQHRPKKNHPNPQASLPVQHLDEL